MNLDYDLTLATTLSTTSPFTLLRTSIESCFTTFPAAGRVITSPWKRTNGVVTWSQTWRLIGILNGYRSLLIPRGSLVTILALLCLFCMWIKSWDRRNWVNVILLSPPTVSSTCSSGTHAGQSIPSLAAVLHIVLGVLVSHVPIVFDPPFHFSSKSLFILSLICTLV